MASYGSSPPLFLRSVIGPICRAPLRCMHTHTPCILEHREAVSRSIFTATYCNTLQHAATRCTLLQHRMVVSKLSWATTCFDTHATWTHCSMLQHIAAHCNTLQHTAHCFKTVWSSRYWVSMQHTATHCNALQHTAAHYSTLQHTAA